MKLRWSPRFARTAGAAAVLTLVVAGVRLQSKPIHPSRWGHWAAGRWLAAHADPEDAVLDTRGWAAFVSGQRSYDYWHVRQAFTDSQLRYVVVGTGELEAGSRRRHVEGRARLRGRAGRRVSRAAGWTRRGQGSGSTAITGPQHGRASPNEPRHALETTGPRHGLDLVRRTPPGQRSRPILKPR